MVDDSLKDTLEKSQKSVRSRPLTLREALSRKRKETEQSSEDSNLIKSLKQDIMCKSSISENHQMDSWSELNGRKKRLSGEGLNNHSVFRFNKFENEHKSKHLPILFMLI